MFKEIRNKPQALFWAILLHVLIVGVLLLSFQWTDRPETTESKAVEVTLPDAPVPPKQNPIPANQNAPH